MSYRSELFGYSVQAPTSALYTPYTKHFRFPSKELQPKRQHTGANAGFALVEVLVALALLGVMASIMAVFVAQTKTIRRLEQNAISEGSLISSIRFVEKTLSSAEFLLLPNADDEAYLRGTATEVEFSGILATGFDTASLRNIRIYVEPSATGPRGALAVSARSRLGDKQTMTPVNILANVRDVKFSYMPTGSDTWEDSWERRRELPKAIKFTVKMNVNGADASYTGTALMALAN